MGGGGGGGGGGGDNDKVLPAVPWLNASTVKPVLGLCLPARHPGICITKPLLLAALAKIRASIANSLHTENKLPAAPSAITLFLSSFSCQFVSVTLSDKQ